MEGRTGSVSPRKEVVVRGRKELDLTTVPGGDGITTLYSQLNTCINDLDQKVGTVLRQHEVDFLSVYKSHMFSIQKEMKLLKEKASDEANKRRRDEEMVKLELERDWFRTEAVRLDALCKDYKRSAEEWKAKATVLEEERQFLQDQVIMAKKVNARSMEQLQTLQQKSRESLLTKSESSPTPQDRSTSSAPANPLFVTHLTPDPHTSTPDLHEQRYKDTISHLRNQLNVSQSALRRIRAVKTDYLLEKGELEDFFLACIEEVKKDIQVRRERMTSYSQRKTPIRPLNESELKFFTDTDKKRVIELLLTQDQVLLFLHRSLFPEPRSQSVARIPEIRQKKGREGRRNVGSPYPRHALFRER